MAEPYTSEFAMPEIEEMDSIDVGRGLRFPEIFSQSTKRCSIQQGIAKINQSLYDIFSTRKGERVLQPEYGSQLHRLLFEMADDVLEDMIKIYVLEAIEQWEPRIEVDFISAERVPDDEHVVEVSIHYRISKTNIQGSYIYPFRQDSRSYPGLS